MDMRQELLIGILAQTDCIWLPLRDMGRADLDACSNSMVLRKAYAETGVRWQSLAAAPDRVRAQLTLEALDQEGAVQVCRLQRGVVGVTLTDAGESEARTLCGLPGFADAWHTLSQVAKYTVRPAKVMADTAISEQFMIFLPFTDPQRKSTAMIVENMALPALNRGWLTSNADAGRCVYYTVTAAGWSALEKPCPKEPTGKQLKGAYAFYIARLADAFRRLREVRLDPREVGAIRYPSGGMGHRSDGSFPPFTNAEGVCA